MSAIARFRPRVLALVLPLSGLLASQTACLPRERAQDRCVIEVNRGFAEVAHAQQRTLEACLRCEGPRECRDGPIEECIGADPLGLVARARERARDGERRACREDAPPDFGTAGAEAASDAAVASALALARGLFGRDLDAARAAAGDDRAAARCQERLLDAAGRCASRFVRGTHRCVAAALRSGADDPFDLVACKGDDPDGAIAGACDEDVATAVAEACGDGHAAALFPGCAGDVASCARGHARRAASLALNDAGALCQDVLPVTLPEKQLLQCFEPPPPEPIVKTILPLPEGVIPNLGAGSAKWQEDDHLVFPFSGGGVTGTQLGRVRVDGSDFRCLTCGAGLPSNVRPVDLFEDGRRVLLSASNAPNARWRILECSPSVLDCQSAQILPIVLPANPDPGNPTLQYRVPHVNRDDAHLVWTEVRARGPGNFFSAFGDLVREADRYVVVNARIVAPMVRSLDLGTDTQAWQRFTANYEAKEGELRGGRDLVVAGTPHAGQYDNFVVELETGNVRPLSSHPDHDEGVSYSPDEEWVVLASARGNERVEFLGLLPRPPYIDGLAFSFHFVAVAGAPSDGISPGTDPIERDCYIEPWLLDRWHERGGYLGQELAVPKDGFEPAPGVAWKYDGTAVVFVEQRWKRLTPPGEAQPGRLVIARLPNRAPIDPAAVVAPVPAPEPSWAVRYEDWILPDRSGETVIPGKVAGTATLVNDLPDVTQGSLEVRYAGYTDDGLHFLDGYERIRIPIFVAAGAEYEVDLTLTGAAAGSMRGKVVYDFVKDVNSGAVVTEWNGRTLEGPKTCEEAGLLQ